VVSEAVAGIDRSDIPAEKESVLAKIREAQATKKSEPRQPHDKERGVNKKSYEPEV
jgi:hypothetical protein